MFLSRYRIKKQDLNLIVDLTLSICLPIAGESVCIPEDGIILLDRESIPACNLTAIVNASKSSEYKIVGSHFVS